MRIPTNPATTAEWYCIKQSTYRILTQAVVRCLVNSVFKPNQEIGVAAESMKAAKTCFEALRRL